MSSVFAGTVPLAGGSPGSTVLGWLWSLLAQWEVPRSAAQALTKPLRSEESTHAGNGRNQAGAGCGGAGSAQDSRVSLTLQFASASKARREGSVLGLGSYPSLLPSLHHTEELIKITAVAAREPSSHRSPALGTQQRWGAADGEEQEHTDWVKCAKSAPDHDRRQPQQHKVARSAPWPLTLPMPPVFVCMTSLHLLPGKTATTKMLSKPAFSVVASNIAHSPVNFLCKQAQYAELQVIIPLNIHPLHQNIPLRGTGEGFPSQGSSAVIGWRGISLRGQGPHTLSIQVTPACTVLQAN